MPDLITSAIAMIMAVPGHTTRTASTALVEALNADISTDYSTNDFGKWRRADRPIPQAVQDWLLRVCLSYAIEACGGKAPAADADIDRLAEMLCPPKKHAVEIPTPAKPQSVI